MFSVFHVKHRVNPVLVWERAEPALDAIAGEDRGVILSRLALDVGFSSPPSGHSIFEFHSRREKEVGVFGRGDYVLVFNLQISRLLKN